MKEHLKFELRPFLGLAILFASYKLLNFICFYLNLTLDVFVQNVQLLIRGLFAQQQSF